MQFVAIFSTLHYLKQNNLQRSSTHTDFSKIMNIQVKIHCNFLEICKEPKVPNNNNNNNNKKKCLRMLCDVWKTCNLTFMTLVKGTLFYSSPGVNLDSSVIMSN